MTRFRPIKIIPPHRFSNDFDLIMLSFVILFSIFSKIDSISKFHFSFSNTIYRIFLPIVSSILRIKTYIYNIIYIRNIIYRFWISSFIHIFFFFHNFISKKSFPKNKYHIIYIVLSFIQQINTIIRKYIHNNIFVNGIILKIEKNIRFYFVYCIIKRYLLQFLYYFLDWKIIV